MATSDRRTRVLVVGGGPAGLAAAARLLERAGSARCRVRLATAGHIFGGKADSWRDTQGRLIDHGLHVILGWYTEMKGLLRRAGVDVEAHLVQNQGHTFIYEPRDGRVHDLALKRNPIMILAQGLGYTGLSAAEKRSIARFVLGNLGVFLGLRDIEPLDDLCFTAWCLAKGLRPSIVQTSAFRMSRTAQLNWPGEISAYSMLRSIVAVARDYKSSRYAFCDGGMSERFWQPVVEHIASLGGEIHLYRNLVGLQLGGGRVVGAVFGEPDPAGHELATRPPGQAVYEAEVPSKPGSRIIDTDLDFVISTIPATAFQLLNPGDAQLWRIPEFARLRELRGVAPLALQIWHRERVTKRYPSVIAGLDGPLPYVLDTKHVIRDYREDPRYGSVIYFVGQETGYERFSDEQHLALCLRNLARLPGFEAIDRRGVIHFQVVRSRAAHKRYFYTEPGIQRFRPHTRTSLPNLFLGGDWVRSELDFPCMETAVRTGIAAADAVLEAMRG
jgi:15-cis-phytoene desaturase